MSGRYFTLSTEAGLHGGSKRRARRVRGGCGCAKKNDEALGGGRRSRSRSGAKRGRSRSGAKRARSRSGAKRARSRGRSVSGGCRRASQKRSISGGRKKRPLSEWMKLSNQMRKKHLSTGKPQAFVYKGKKYKTSRPYPGRDFVVAKKA